MQPATSAASVISTQQFHDLQQFQSRVRSMGEYTLCTVALSHREREISSGSGGGGARSDIGFQEGAGMQGMMSNPLHSSSTGNSPSQENAGVSGREGSGGAGTGTGVGTGTGKKVVVETVHASPKKRRRQVQTRLISTSTSSSTAPPPPPHEAAGLFFTHNNNNNNTHTHNNSGTAFPYRVDLSKHHLTTQEIKFQTYLQPHQFAQVHTLLLHHNKFTLIERLFLPKRFPRLQELDLSNNAIAANLTRQCFPKTLVKLDLSHNEIKYVKELIHLPCLQELNLSHNKLRHVDPLPTTLTKLDLSYNWIEEMESFDTLKVHNKSLIWLNIMHNSIPPAYLNLVAKELVRSLPCLCVSPVDFDALYADYDLKTVYKQVLPKDSQTLNEIVTRLSTLSPERYHMRYCKNETEREIEKRESLMKRQKEKAASYLYTHSAHHHQSHNLSLYEEHGSMLPLHERLTESVKKYRDTKEEVIVVGDRSKPYTSPIKSRPKSRSTTPTYNNNNNHQQHSTSMLGSASSSFDPMSASLLAPTKSSQTRELLQKQEKEEEDSKKKKELEKRSLTPTHNRGSMSMSMSMSRSSSRSSIAGGRRVDRDRERGSNVSVSSRSTVSTVRSSTILRKVLSDAQGQQGHGDITIQSILLDDSSLSIGGPSGTNMSRLISTRGDRARERKESVDDHSSVNSSITGIGTIGNSTILTKDSTIESKREKEKERGRDRYKEKLDTSLERDREIDDNDLDEQENEMNSERKFDRDVGIASSQRGGVIRGGREKERESPSLASMRSNASSLTNKSNKTSATAASSSIFAGQKVVSLEELLGSVNM
jgi:hypothetical protein